jgi:carbon monoxide dehydrogenase subunit G
MVQREQAAVTTVEYSVEVNAPPEVAWEVVADPRSLPHWDKHIHAVDVPPGGLGTGVRYRTEMSFLGVRASVPCEVREWEPPWRATVHLGGLLDATVVTAIAALPYERCVLRHEVTFVFRGPLGRFGAASVNAVGGALAALRRGTLAQRRQIERLAASR